uniref:Uncharacterized protein n=1 Tax=Romanomermis culicivorax TaxID=13658 RepID=A0A915HUG8_ROMCU
MILTPLDLLEQLSRTKLKLEAGPGRYSVETLNKNVNLVLENFENRTKLLFDLLCSYALHLKAAHDAQG